MGEEKLWREEESGEAVRDEDAISDEEVSGLADMEELSSKDDEMVERDPVSIRAVVVVMVDVLVRWVKGVDISVLWSTRVHRR